MRKLILAGLLTVASAGAALADPVEGVWKTAPGDTGGYLHVKISTCGAALCGTIQKALAKDGSESADYEHLGKKMIWDMQAEGGGAYSGGKIWAPDSDKTYKSKMSLSGSKLNVKGCVGGGLICRGQDWMQEWGVDTKADIAKTMAVFGAFTEGLQLFASFAMLMNFPRFNKMKGMGQIVTWSVRDESLHTVSVIKLFKTFLQENPEVWTEQLQEDLYTACKTIVHHEDAFIDLAFEMGPIEGLSAQEVKDYIRYIADRRLTQLGLEPVYNQENNPLRWMDEILNGVEHANFFENRATEYSKASTQGTWEEAFM